MKHEQRYNLNDCDSFILFDPKNEKNFNRMRHQIRDRNVSSFWMMFKNCFSFAAVSMETPAVAGKRKEMKSKTKRVNGKYGICKKKKFFFSL